MTRKNPFALLGTWLAITFAPSPAAEPGGTSNPKSEEVVVLSPFVLNTEKDVGYAATNTLAGTRLSTSVKDIGAAISIYTKEFLNDLGATSANDFLIYATGMEAAGAQGNFSGATSDINAPQVTGDSARTQPQNATRTRGLSAPNYTRGFFTTSIPVDTYNTDMVTVNRGPNAILFGVGSPAGVVDATLLQANLRRNLNTVEFRYGNNDSFRRSLDLNRVLIPNKLALRLAAVDDEEKFNQRPAFEHKKRIYGTVAAKPFRSTTVRSSFETGRTTANRPLSVLPFKSVSDAWFAAGRPVFDWTFFDDPARNPNAINQNANVSATTGGLAGQIQFFDQIAIVYSQPNAAAPNFAFRGTTPNTAGTVADAVRNSLFHPLVNRDLRADAIVTAGTFNVGQLPAAAFPGGVVPAGIKMQGFTDYSAFDFENRMLDETSRQGDTFRTFNVTLEQLAWKDRIGVELAYNTERYDVRSKNSFFQSNNGNHVSIDASVSLPNGQPNPNVGRPRVMYGQIAWTHTLTSRETARATAFLRYDFKEVSPRTGRWLGRHTLTGLYEQNSVDTLGYSYRLATDGAVANSINPNPNVFDRRPGVMVYIGDSVLDGRPLALQPIRIPELNAGLTVPTSYFVAPAGSTAQGDFAVVPTTLTEIINGGNSSREVIKSQAAVLQSYWLGEHLVTTLGWRRDEDYFANRAISFVPANPTKVHYGFNDFSFASLPPPAAAKEVKTYSAVLRWPQKLLRLPRGADASVFVNRSENFTPLGSRINAYGQPLASPQGKTSEFGINLSFLNDRFSLRVNRFETTVKGQTLNNVAFNLAINNAVLQNTGIWASEQNINPSINRSADVELMYSVLPPNFRELMQWRISGTPAQQNLSPSHTVISGIADTTDFTAKGTEVEFIFNPNRQWRILANVANQETIQTNTLPGAKEFINRMLPVWNQLRSVPRNNYPAGHVLGDPLLATEQTFGQYLDAFVLIPFATAIATEGSSSAEQRKWRANLVANYTFSREGRLTGWSVGTGVRWQDKLGIGYPSTRNSDGSVFIDLKHPYYAPAETNVDAFVGYTRKIFRDRITWKAQLNVRNAIGKTGPVAVTVQPWGETAIVRLAPERRWYLTNTFSF